MIEIIEEKRNSNDREIVGVLHGSGRIEARAEQIQRALCHLGIVGGRVAQRAAGCDVQIHRAAGDFLQILVQGGQHIKLEAASRGGHADLEGLGAFRCCRLRICGRRSAAGCSRAGCAAGSEHRHAKADGSAFQEQVLFHELVLLEMFGSFVFYGRSSLRPFVVPTIPRSRSLVNSFFESVFAVFEDKFAFPLFFTFFFGFFGCFCLIF